jgi:hypothetical protein
MTEPYSDEALVLAEDAIYGAGPADSKPRVAAALQKLMDERDEAQRTFRCVEESEQYLAMQKRAEAVEASKAECVRLVRDWYELQKELQFGDVLLQILKEHSAPEQRSVPVPVPADTLDLDELQRLCDAATPGPWNVVVFELDRAAWGSYEPTTEQHNADMRLVDAARDALPKLIAEVRRLRGAP